MRLVCVEKGHRLRQKLLLTLIRVFSLRKPPDVVKTLLYRPEAFGGPYSAILQETLRGPSSWTVGERELFAAFTSRLNECRF
jgi:hypothetical protein